MPSRSSLRRRCTAVVLVAAVVLAACTDDGADATSATSTTIPRPSTVMRVGVEDWPACVNPLTCRDEVLHEQILQHVLPVAFEVDAEDDHRPSALLANTPEFTVQDETAEIRYRIAPEARWADGRPITSSDFVGTWQAVMTTPEADRLRYENIVDIDDRDPAVAVVTLDTPLVDWKELFGGSTSYLLQADAFGASTDLTGQFGDELPFAAGPYLLTSWDDNGAVLSATQPWEGLEAPGIDQVRLDRVDIAGLDDPMTFDMLLPAAGSTVEPPEGFDVRRTGTTTVLGLWFDQREPGLQPVEQRRAFELLFDREALAEEAGLGDVVRCAGWLPDVGPWCGAASVDPAEVDRASALTRLAAVGWQPGGFGVLFRDGIPLTVPVTVDPDVAGADRVATAVRDALADIGVQTQVIDKTTAEWIAADRPISASTGLGVFAIDLGTTPRVDDLYGCPAGLESSVVASCPDEIVFRARALTVAAPEEAVSTVETIGTAVADAVFWLPLGVLREASFLRPGRVVAADASHAAGGPLAGLERFQADN